MNLVKRSVSAAILFGVGCILMVALPVAMAYLAFNEDNLSVSDMD